jgi:outer membrane protein OmpA-like peptidoglycan-associated protein
VRITVLHDDAYVHEIVASYPRALLRSAMGLHVDPLDMAVSEIQSAFVAPAGSGFKTYQMGSKPVIETAYATAAPVPPARYVEPEPEPEPEPVMAPAPEPEPVDVPEPEPEPAPAAREPWRPAPYVADIDDDQPRRRRALLVVPLVVLLVAAIGGGSWYLGRDDQPASASGKPHKNGQSANDRPSNKPSTQSPQATPSDKPSATKTAKPTVTLKSDLAFDKNSAVLSSAAKVAIDKIADQVVAAQLRGTIYIHGYTDNLGSAAHGLELSKQRASAVAQYLRSALGSYDIPINAIGHGEANPIADNSTEAGRKKNRRVTITLPKK